MSKRKSKKTNNSTQGSSFSVDPDMMKFVMGKFFSEVDLSAALDGRIEKKSKKNASPLEKAQDLIHDAMESFDPQERIQLAREALNLSADCADAYCILAASAKSDDEALSLYREGVLAGERALGTELFQTEVGNFWLLLSTRPYMRARFALANLLWDLGQNEESLVHMRELMRLNPGDNQGIRYTLASKLLELGLDQELSELLDRYDEDSTEWLFQKAILAYRQEGDTPHARKLLKKAGKSNQHVAVYMADFKMLPMTIPPTIRPGAEDEAIHYVATCRSGWRTTSGAIPWLRSVLKPEPPADQDEPKLRVSRSRKIAFEHLAELPQTEEVWQVDHVAQTLNDSEFSIPLWLWIVATVDEEVILDQDLLEAKFSSSEVFEKICKLMACPRDREASRPKRIEVNQKALAKFLTPKLKKIGVECAFQENLSNTASIAEKMSEFLEKQTESSPEPPEIDELLTLPIHADERWQIDCREIPSWIQCDGELKCPWMLLIANEKEEKILGQSLSENCPTAEQIWQVVAATFVRPHFGEPGTPGAIELISPKLRAALLPHLESLGVNCYARDNLPQLDMLFESLAQQLAGKTAIPAISESPGVTESLMSEFFAAAADFFRRAPWRRIRGDIGIMAECPNFKTHSWYSVVMGQSGMMMGLAMYDNREIFDRLMRSAEADDKNAEKMSGMTVSFGEAYDMSPVDVEACKRNGWALATTEAYPHAIWIDPGFAMRTPLKWELELLTGMLRAIPAYIDSGSKSTLTQDIPVNNQTLKITLSRMEN